MATNPLKTLAKWATRKTVRKSAPLGPLVAELQDIADAEEYVQTHELSFNTNEQGATKVYFPHATRINRIRLFVTSPLAGTDAGTVTAKDSGGNNLAAVASLAASSAFGTEATITPTGFNDVAEDGYIQLVTAKTTAGGKVRAMIEYSLTQPAQP